MSGGYDIIDKARHWLIRKLSCGDLIMINFSLDDAGIIDRRNLGPALIGNVDVEMRNDESGIYVGWGAKKNGNLHLKAMSNLCFSNVWFRKRFPSRGVAE